MDHTPPFSQTFASQSQQEEENQRSICQHFTDVVKALPSLDGGAHGKFHRHPDGWYGPLDFLVGTMIAQKHFKAWPSDVLLISLPKSGTTWLKALLFAAVHRRSFRVGSSDQPLATLNPHECIPFLEWHVYANGQIPDLDSLPTPCLFAAHFPFQSLPASVVDSGCRIVYLCRDPKDNFVALWSFMTRITGTQEPIESALDRFCKGITSLGLWDHMLGYWKAHLERPDKVLFLKYEELKEDPVGQLRRLAEFVGCPFTVAEEEERVAEGIVELCGIENLRNVEVNKSGSTKFAARPVKNNSFFRRGVVGDSVNYLTPEMARRVDELTESKFKGSGLTFPHFFTKE